MILQRHGGPRKHNMHDSRAAVRIGDGISRRPPALPLSRRKPLYFSAVAFEIEKPHDRLALNLPEIDLISREDCWCAPQRYCRLGNACLSRWRILGCHGPTVNCVYQRQVTEPLQNVDLDSNILYGPRLSMDLHPGGEIPQNS